MSQPFPGTMKPPSDTRGPMLVQAMWIMAGIATPVVVARLVARIKHRGWLGWDDYIMTFSLVFEIVGAGLMIKAVQDGYGRHVYHLTQEQIIQLMRTIFISIPFFGLALMAGRVSFAVSLLKLMGTEKYRRVLLWFIIVTQFVTVFTNICIIMFGCIPISKFWDTKTPGTCLDPRAGKISAIIQAAFGIFADLVLALLPSLVIAKLKLKRSLKFGLIFLMALGVFNMAAAILTLESFVTVKTIEDPTYDSIITGIWSGIQVYIVIVIASLPFLRPLFKNNMFFTSALYRSWLARYSQKSGSSGNDRRLSDRSDRSEHTLCADNDKHLQSLPHIPKDRFVTTTLRNAGPGMNTEHTSSENRTTGTLSGFDSLSTVEDGFPAKG